jgi:SAM-dependent methyltransferase
MLQDMTQKIANAVDPSLSDAQWLDILSAAEPRGFGLPLLPPQEVQARYTGQSGRAAFDQALKFVSFCVSEARAHGVAINADTRLVDLGCGWGRISQSAMRDFAPRNIYSVDVAREAIALCRDTGLSTNLVLAPSSGPVPLETGIADILICYSVFSHLREDQHLLWLREVQRLLRPGGVAILTTRPRSMPELFAYMRGIGMTDCPAFRDIADVLRRYDAGEFVFDAPHQGGELDAVYGEAMIAPQYVEREWSKIFSQVTFRDVSDRIEQAAIVAIA